MQSLEELRKEKDSVLRMEPYSGGNIEGKGDVVFFWKQPGDDAFLYDSGTIVFRHGFGDKRKAAIKPSFKKGFEALRAQGYRPAPYFRPGFREQYEIAHNNAKEKEKKAGEFFPVVQKLNIRDIKAAQMNYPRIPMQAPTLQQPMIYRQQPMRQQQPIMRQPMVRQIQNADEEYIKLFRTLDETNRLFTGKSRIQAPNTFKILEPAKFYNWSRGEYAGVIGREIELEIRSRKKETSKEKLEKAKKEAAKLKKMVDKKEGDDYE
jgi:hypothetical protein